MFEERYAPVSIVVVVIIHMSKARYDRLCAVVLICDIRHVRFYAVSMPEAFLAGNDFFSAEICQLCDRIIVLVTDICVFLGHQFGNKLVLLGFETRMSSIFYSSKRINQLFLASNPFYTEMRSLQRFSVSLLAQCRSVNRLVSMFTILISDSLIYR